MSRVSPKTADPALRVALIEAAARLVATEGRAGLTLRRLAREVGTSTMALYTHFGSMDELRRAVRREGFTRLGKGLGEVPETDDPVADLALLGLTYYERATAAPNLYRAMFLDGPIDAEDAATGLDTFMYLVNGIARCADAGILRAVADVDPAELAVEMWAATHGIVSLQLAHLLDGSEALARFRSMGGSLLKAWGASAESLGTSWVHVEERQRAPS